MAKRFTVEDILNTKREEGAASLEQVDPATGLPHSIVPGVLQTEEDLPPEVPEQQIEPEDTSSPDTKAKSPISINPLSSDNKGENLDKALVGASGISSVMQEVLARRQGRITGKDPNVEINQIRAGQQRLESNLERKEELRKQLEEKLAERKQKESELDLRRQQVGQDIEAGKQRMDIQQTSEQRAQEEYSGASPEAVVYQRLLVKSGKYKPEDVENMPAAVGKQLLNGQISLEEAHAKAGLQTKYEFQTIIGDDNKTKLVAVNKNTGIIERELGNKGYAPQTVVDPSTGNRVIIQGGEASDIKGLAKPEAKVEGKGVTFQQMNPKEREYTIKQQRDYTDAREKLLDGQSSLQNAKNDLQMATTNANAANSLVMQLNRLAGDKGPIRADEFAMFKGDPSILNRFKRFIGTHVQGQVVTEQDKKLLGELLSSYESTFNTKKQNLRNLHLNQLRTKIPNVDPSVLDGVQQQTGQTPIQSDTIPEGKTGKLKDGTPVIRKGGVWVRQ
jgi:hypothetical protein